MPELSLTEAQYDRLEAVREDVEEAFVDGYGQARLSDALDYLLDTYTPPEESDVAPDSDDYDRIATAEYPELQHVAAEVPDIPGSGIDADEMRGKLLSTLGPTELADRLAAQDFDTDDAEAAVDEDSDGEPAEIDTETATDDGEEAASSSDSGASDEEPADPLSAVNRLLREHDDKWRRVEDGDEPYEVDLPDGTTEGVRTRDDVRQYLFQHY